MLINLHTRIFCVYGLITLQLFYTVQGQCTIGDEKTCLWRHDEKSALKWVSKTDPDGTRFIELTGCEHPNCGIATLVTPWLPPRDSEVRTTFDYRLYGTSNVYLRLYMTTEDSAGQNLIFTKEGNYALPYTEEWTEKSVVIPAIPSKHRLLLKAHTPYKEAMVAVKNINIGGILPPLPQSSVEVRLVKEKSTVHPVPQPTVENRLVKEDSIGSVLPKATEEVQLAEEDTTSTLFKSSSDNFTDVTEYESEEENEIDQEESQTEETLKQAGLYSHSSTLSPILHGYHLHPYLWLSVLMSVCLTVAAYLAFFKAVDDKKKKIE